MADPFPVIPEDWGPPCPDCGAWHGRGIMKHLVEDVPCGHDRARPCEMCGKPVGNLSMGGSDICAWCDTGHPELRPEGAE